MTPPNVIEVDFGTNEPEGEQEENSFECAGQFYGKVITYSEKRGYLIEETIWERRAGKKWVRLSDDEYYNDLKGSGVESYRDLIQSGTHRRIETRKPISEGQAMRIFLHGFDPKGEWILLRSFNRLLDRAGIEPLEL